MRAGIPLPVILGVFVAMVVVLLIFGRKQGGQPSVEPATLTPQDRERGVQAVLDLPLSYRYRRLLHAENLVFSPTGRFIAGSSEDGFHIWSAGDGTRVAPEGTRFLLMGGSLVRILAYSSDGGRLAAAVEDQYRAYLMVWDTATGKREADVTIEEQGLSALAWSPDGQRLAWLSSGAVGVWEPETGNVFRGEIENAFGLAWFRAPDGGERIAVRTGSALVHLDPRTLRTESTLDIDADTFFLGFVGTGDRFVQSYRDRVELWDTSTGTVVASAAGATPEVGTACAPPALDWVALGGDGGVLEIWHPGEDRPSASLAAHEGGILSMAAAPGGKLVTTDTAAGRVWNVSLLETMYPAASAGP